MSIRAALDIGSSQHKLVVAKVAADRTAPITILYSTAIRVPLADSLTTSNTLPDSILAQCTTAIQQLISLAREHGATEYAAIATEIFRSSSNGLHHLSRICEQESLPLVLLSPFEEGVLSFRAAARLCTHVHARQVVVWDSGGASSQWTHRQHRMHVHAIRLGSASMRAVARRFAHARDLVRLLRAYVRAVATPMSEALAQKVAAGAVCGIGGASSMFALAAEKVGNVVITADAVQMVVNDLRVHDDVMPKMVLLSELMNVYAIRAVKYVPANGSCCAMITSDDARFWKSASSDAYCDSAQAAAEEVFVESACGGVTPSC